MPPVEEPCTIRSRARPDLSSIEVIVESAWSSQLTPSSTLREYCAPAARSARSLIASLVPVGESDGRLMFRPVDSFSWAVESRPRPNCSEARDRSTISRWVIRAAAHQWISPVRLIRVSSIESMVVSTREAPSYPRWAASRLTISSSMLMPETDSREASTWEVSADWLSEACRVASR